MDAQFRRYQLCVPSAAAEKIYSQLVISLVISIKSCKIPGWSAGHGWKLLVTLHVVDAR